MAAGRRDIRVKDRVLVTGANGFVGGHLCAELLRRGNAVRGAVRSPSAAEVLPGDVEPFVVPDVGPGTDWSAGLEGVEAVVHLAGRVHVTREEGPDPLSAYRRVNVEGTARLLEASVEAGARRLVFLSSVKAVGEGGPAAYTEETPCRPADAYGISKLEAERALSEAAPRIETVVVRPPLVYGPGVRANFLKLIGAVSRGLPLPLGRVENARSMVYVRNLTDAISLCLEHPAAAGETFLVADEERPSTRELVSKLGGFLGRPARLAPVPVPLLRLGGRLEGRSDQVERMVGTLTVSTAKIRDVSGWTPPYSMEKGLKATALWIGRSA